ncbi:MAG: Type IV fimbrial assembly protein PilC, partial [uncultured Solirubrobacteraceae bacterium]
EHLRLQGDGLRGSQGLRRGRGRVQAGRRRPAQAARPRRAGDRRQAQLARDQHRGAEEEGQARGAHDHDPSAVDDGQLGDDDSARALRPRGADGQQDPAGDHRPGPQGRGGRPTALRRVRAPPEALQPAVRVDDARGGDRRHARRRAAARRRPAREGGLPPSPGQERHGLPRGGHELRRHRPDRPGRLHRPGVRLGLRLLRRRTPGHHEVHRDAERPRDGLLVAVHGGGRRARLRLPPLEALEDRSRPVGHAAPAHPDGHRQHRAEDRAGPLVTDPERAGQRGRPDPAGARDHGQDGRQPRRREGDAGRDRQREGRRHHRRTAGQGPGVPRNGLLHAGRRRGDGRARHHAVEDRRLLRGPGRGRRQAAHVDPRADHDRDRGRHRRLHRDRDVHAAVQGVRPDQV